MQLILYVIFGIYAELTAGLVANYLPYALYYTFYGGFYLLLALYYFKLCGPDVAIGNTGEMWLTGMAVVNATVAGACFLLVDPFMYHYLYPFIWAEDLGISNLARGAEYSAIGWVIMDYYWRR